VLNEIIPVYALIPARGGSEGIPRKNLAPLAGKALIDYTICAAKESHFIDEIWVSSDDEETLNHSKRSNVKTLQRPAILAANNSHPATVVSHFLQYLPDIALELDAFILYLQPTSPLRKFFHIDAAINQMLSASSTSVISVTKAEKPPFKAFKLDGEGRLLSLFDEKLSNLRRQDLPQCFYPNGAIYGFFISEFKKKQGFPSNGSFPYLMSKSESVDIDSIDDLIFAENILGK
jgi:CMP-N,N'-diacetyllegionaminic acid synthase